MAHIELFTARGLRLMHREARKLSVLAGALALVIALGATASTGDAASGRTVTARGSDQFVPNAKVMATFRFSPGNITVASGENLTFTNDTDEPHTLSIVDEADVPSDIDSVFTCGEPGTICDEIFSLFPGEPTDAVFINAGGGAGLDARLDTQFIPPGGTITTPVTAPSGSTLYFICAIHAWMQGTIDVK